MTAVFLGVLALALVLALSPPGAPRHRIRTAFSAGQGADTARRPAAPGGGSRWRRRRTPADAMTQLVQQMAALLTGGRTPARLWDDLWLLQGGGPAATVSGRGGAGGGEVFDPGALRMLATARAAAARGSPVGTALRTAAARTGTDPRANRVPGQGGELRARRVWLQLAACLDVAEASGCPLAEVLTRFAAQLEAEDDAEAARQTALAGPRATVRLLTWLPFLGLGLGLLLGVDPAAVLLGTPVGMAALAGGLVLTLAGRIWSSRLVHAAGGPPP